MRVFSLAVLLLAFLLPSATLASGDAAAGKTKGYTCTGCHGIPGYKNVYPTYRVPKIAGQSAVYIESALKAYRAGERDHSTMNLQAESLSDEDIADLAAWLSSKGKGEEK